MPKRRFQFSLAELFVGVFACGALGLLCSLILNVVEEDYAMLGRAIGATLLVFIVGCVFIVLPYKELLERSIRLVVWFIVVGLLSVILTLPYARSRMARNETNAEMLCMSFCVAENEYCKTAHNGSGIREYAQSLHDLFETRPGAADLKFIAKEFADAEAGKGTPKPFKGYFFRVLKEQGPHAMGGRPLVYVERKACGSWDSRCWRIQRSMTSPEEMFFLLAMRVRFMSVILGQLRSIRLCK